jgi:translation initiation factor 1
VDALSCAKLETLARAKIVFALLKKPPEMLIPNEFEPDFGVTSKSNQIHIRNQQRNGKKSITSVSGFGMNTNLVPIMKTLKKQLATSAHIQEDDEFGKVLCVQGDFRDAIAKFLVEQDLCDRSQIKIHGACALR